MFRKPFGDFLGLKLGLSLVMGAVCAALAQSVPPPRDTNSAVIAKIREEGLERSQVMQTLSYLTDVIGPRLTGSPNIKRANEWTRDRLQCWGLTNAQLEAWGPFGRGWTLKRFSAQVVEPQTIPLGGYPCAWTPGLTQPLEADVVFLDATSSADLEKYKSKLKGAIVLISPLREVQPRFIPLAARLNETNLLRLANAGESRGFGGGINPLNLGPGNPVTRPGSESRSSDSASSRTNAPRSRFPARFGGARNISFCQAEGAALVVNASSDGDGGTFFVSGASVPIPEGRSYSNAPRAWSTNVPPIPPQITLAIEDYNRLVRMLQQGEKLKMRVDLRVAFNDDDLMSYNTVAELPGSDLKDEIVMLGGHIDSWHSGTGATDNGIGVAATMEAMRILATLKLQPRRTIRIGLWSGEEQGLLGSKAYVARHFGYYTNVTESSAVRSPKDEANSSAKDTRSSTNSTTTRKLFKLKEYEKLSAYFNLDNGAGRIRGVYLQGNDAVRPLFRRWLEPFRDLDAETITLSNTVGTDHQSFDAIGLPGFQFIQDPLDYRSRTHHANEDVYDRVPPEDARQAAVILAAFAWDAANADKRLPRKPTE